MQLTIRHIFISILVLGALYACNQKRTEDYLGSFPPSITAVVQNSIPLDSIGDLINIPVDEKQLKEIPAREPFIVPVENNIHPAAMPKTVIAGRPVVSTPGMDTFLLPRKTPVIEKPIPAKMPETFVVREMTYKTPNPASIGSFGKLHGLKNTIVTALLQDNEGSIWICTASGVSRFDGRCFHNISVEQGLLFEDVRSVLQDRKGIVWFGTLGGGVFRYDGYSFVNFTAKDGLCSDAVECIMQDREGNLWFGTQGGITKYDGHVFTNFTQQQGLIGNVVYCMIEDRAGNIWAGTCAGLSRYDGRTFTNFNEKQGLSNNNVYCLLEDRPGNLLIGTYGGGISKFDGSSFISYTSKQGLINDDVGTLIKDRQGNIWIGTRYGLSKYDGSAFTNFTEKQGLTNDNIYCLLEDNYGNIWIGTGGGGVLKYNDHSFTHFTQNEGLRKNYIFSVHEDKEGKLWFGSWRGGMAQYDGITFRIFTNEQGLPDNDVRSICEDKSGNFWLATYDGAVKYNGHSFIHFTERNGLVNNDVNCIMEDSSGNIWFGTNRGVSKYDGHSFSNFFYHKDDGKSFRCIKQDKTGNIWFGTGEGVFKLDGRRLIGINDSSKTLSTPIYCIGEDRTGNLWFGTGKGAFKYDGRSLIRITTREGLVNNEITSIMEDDGRNIWFGTRFGLSKLSIRKSALLSQRIRAHLIYKEDVFFKNYGYAENFLGIGCNTGAMMETSDHHMWVGTNNGVTTFEPSKEPADSTPPVIQITKLKIGGQNIDWAALKQKTDTSILLNTGMQLHHFRFNMVSPWHHLPEGLSLEWDNNYISFEFVGTTMGQPQNVRYQYYLEGLDQRMGAVTGESSVSYGNLPPGKYTFKVRAMNSEGVWSRELDYGFIIRPPWWQTWWFRTAVILTFSGFVFFISRFIYLYQLRKQKNILEKELAVQFERQRISADLHDEIGSTLSSISIYAALAKNEEHKASYLESISSNVTEVVTKLDDLVWRINPKYDSMESVISRLTGYAEPFAWAKGITLSLEADEVSTSIKLPADSRHHLFMVLKELINNAIKHAACTAIKINFYCRENNLQIVVEDNGKGFDADAFNKHRNGLHNIEQRVRAMNGIMEMTTVKGTSIDIRIPVD